MKCIILLLSFVCLFNQDVNGKWIPARWVDDNDLQNWHKFLEQLKNDDSKTHSMAQLLMDDTSFKRNDEPQSISGQEPCGCRESPPVCKVCQVVDCKCPVNEPKILVCGCPADKCSCPKTVKHEEANTDKSLDVTSSSPKKQSKLPCGCHSHLQTTISPTTKTNLVSDKPVVSHCTCDYHKSLTTPQISLIVTSAPDISKENSSKCACKQNPVTTTILPPTVFCGCNPEGKTTSEHDEVETEINPVITTLPPAFCGCSNHAKTTIPPTSKAECPNILEASTIKPKESNCPIIPTYKCECVSKTTTEKSVISPRLGQTNNSCGTSKVSPPQTHNRRQFQTNHGEISSSYKLRCPRINPLPLFEPGKFYNVPFVNRHLRS